MRLLTRLSRHQGITLVELMVGMVLLVVGILGIAVATSKSMRSAKNDQLHWMAAGIAASKIQEIKLYPLQTIFLTDAGTATGWFPDSNSTGAQGCDCSNTALNWAAMTPIVAHKDYSTSTSTTFPYSEVVTMGGVDFTCKVCVNRLEGAVGALRAYCPMPAGAPTGTAYQQDYRLVRVQVSWTDPQGRTSTTETETLVGMQL